MDRLLRYVRVLVVVSIVSLLVLTALFALILLTTIHPFALEPHYIEPTPNPFHSAVY